MSVSPRIGLGAHVSIFSTRFCALTYPLTLY